MHFGFELIEAHWFRQSVQARHRDPRVTAPGHDPHATTRIVGERLIKASYSEPHSFAEATDELGRIGWLPQRFVVDFLGRFEIGREIMVGVTPPAGIIDEHLPTTDSVAKGDKHAQLIRNPLNTPTVVDDRGPPALRHNTIKRYGICGFVVAGLAGGRRVSLQQLDRVEDRPVGSVVRPEDKRVEQRGKHAPVVRRVRRPQHRTDSVVEYTLLCSGFTNQVAQSAFIDNWVHGGADRVVGSSDGNLGDPKQNLVLATDTTQIRDQFTFHASISVRVDLVDQPEEQINQRVGNLGLTRPAQRSNERHPDRHRRCEKIRPVGPGRSLPPRLNNSRRDVLEQIDRDAQLADRVQLGDLTQQRFETELARVGLQLGEEPGFRRFVDEAFQHLDSARFETRDSAGAERPFERCATSTNNPVCSARWLDTQCPAVARQRAQQMIGAMIDRAHFGSEPPSESVFIMASTNTETERFPDLRTMCSTRPLTPPVGGKLASLDTNLPCDEGDHEVAELRWPAREPCLMLEELQHQREAEPRRAGLVPDQFPIRRD